MPGRLSKDCQDLISKMITVDHTARITALECLNHQWFNQLSNKDLIKSMSLAEQSQMDREVLQRMQSYRGQSLLKKAAVNVLVKHLEAD